MRKIAIIAASIAALLIVALIAFVLLFNVDKYRPRIQAELQKQLNRPVTIGKVGLRLFPLAARLDNVVVGESPAFPSQQPFAAAEKLYVSVGLFSLIRGQIGVKSLRLERPQIHLIRNAEGVWNFSTLGKSSAPPPATKAASGESNQANISLDDLRIEDGRVVLTDLAAKKLSGTFDHIDLRVKDYAPKKRFSVDLGVHLPGEGNQLLAVDAEVGPIPDGNAAATPVEGDLSLNEVSFSGIQKFLSLPGMEGTDTVASGKAKINTTKGLYECKGDLKLEKTRIQGTSIDSPIEANYDVTHDPNRELLQIKSADLKLGSTPLSVSGDVDLHSTPSGLNLRASTKNASITEIAKIAGAAGVAFNPNYQIKGGITADITAKGTAKQPALTGTLLAKDVEVSGGEIKQPVRVPELNLNLTPDAIRSNSFTASSGKTSLNGSFALSQYTTPNSLIDASLKTQDASVAELLSMAKAYGVEGAEGATGSGNLSLDVRVQGPLSETKNLKYAGSGKLANVVLNWPTLTKPVSVKNADLRFQENDANLENLSASLGSTNLQGQLSVRDFAAPQLKFALSADKINIDELSTLAKTNVPKQAKAATPQAAQKQAVAAKAPATNEPSLLEKVSGGGTIAIGTVIAQQMVLSNVRTTAAFDHGVIRLSPLSSGIFSGQQTGTISLDMRPVSPLVNLNVKFAGVDANQMLSALSTAKNVLTGSLNATTNGSFRLVQNGDIAPTLNGTASINLTNGKIQNINILDQLSKVGKFLSNTSGQAGTNLKQFSGTMQIQNGVATTNNLIAVIDQGSLSAKGSINLVNQGLNLRTNAVLGQGYSQTVGGSKIGGFLNTALANNKGELVLPVIVTGTFDKPVFQPDVQGMAEMKLKNLLPTTGDPSKLGSGLLNSLLGGKKSNDPNQKEQPKPQDAVKSLFDRFKKKK